MSHRQECYQSFQTHTVSALILLQTGERLVDQRRFAGYTPSALSVSFKT